MKILITDGAGYIGTVLTQLLLERGHSVRCYDVAAIAFQHDVTLISVQADFDAINIV
jgi:nucleoside-diphosphate-sugar epimerase